MVAAPRAIVELVEGSRDTRKAQDLKGCAHRDHMLEKLKSLSNIFRRSKVKHVTDDDTALFDLSEQRMCERTNWIFPDGPGKAFTTATTSSSAEESGLSVSSESQPLQTFAQSSSATKSYASNITSLAVVGNFSNLEEKVDDNEVNLKQCSARPESRGRKWFDYSDDSCTRFLPASYVVCDTDPNNLLDANDLQDTDRILSRSSHFLQSYYFISTFREHRTAGKGRESLLLRGKGRRPAAVAIEDKAIVDGKKAPPGQQVFFHGGLPGVHETDLDKPQQPLPLGVS